MPPFPERQNHVSQVSHDHSYPSMAGSAINCLAAAHMDEMPVTVLTLCKGAYTPASAGKAVREPMMALGLIFTHYFRLTTEDPARPNPTGRLFQILLALGLAPSHRAARTSLDTCRSTRRPRILAISFGRVRGSAHRAGACRDPPVKLFGGAIGASCAVAKDSHARHENRRWHTFYNPFPVAAPG